MATEDEQTAPAAAVDAPVTPEAVIPRPLEAPLSASAAAEMLADWKPDDAPELLKPSEPDAPAVAEESQEEAQPTAEAQEAVPADEEKAEPDPNAEEELVAHGNMKVRLRDRTSVTVAEAKPLIEAGREYERIKPQLEQRFQELQAREAQLAQKDQYAQHVLSLTQQFAQTKLPQPPDPKLATEDPIEHYQQMVLYNQEMGQFQQLQQAQQARMAMAKREHDVQAAQRLTQETNKLLSVRPELRDPAKANDFTRAYSEAAKLMGFNDEEAANVHDHRLVVGVVSLYEKAKRWDEHLAKQAAQKTVVQAKVATAVPVAAPTKREAPKAADQAKADELIQRAMKTGRPGDAAAALALFD
jgi:hypothetical protein